MDCHPSRCYQYISQAQQQDQTFHSIHLRDWSGQPSIICKYITNEEGWWDCSYLSLSEESTYLQCPSHHPLFHKVSVIKTLFTRAESLSSTLRELLDKQLPHHTDFTESYLPTSHYRHSNKKNHQHSEAIHSILQKLSILYVLNLWPHSDRCYCSSQWILYQHWTRLELSTGFPEENVMDRM